MVVATAVSESGFVPPSDPTLCALFPFLIIRLSLRAVFDDRDGDPSESESDDDPSEPDELKYWAAGPGTASLSTNP
jgi:hypothetical protein